MAQIVEIQVQLDMATLKKRIQKVCDFEVVDIALPPFIGVVDESPDVGNMLVIEVYVNNGVHEVYCSGKVSNIAHVTHCTPLPDNYVTSVVELEEVYPCQPLNPFERLPNV